MINVTDSNIEEYISNIGLLVIKFTADWCGNCPLIEKSLNELDEQYKKVCFIKANVAVCEKTCKKFGIMSLPSVVFIKNGEKVGIVIGAKPKEIYEEVIEKHERGELE